jgi:hypothetical protein
MRFKEKRSMKVYAGNDQNYKPVAQIRLQGKWLEEIGWIFRCGGAACPA